MPVKGMTCSTCEVRVRAALERAGATYVQADFRRGETRFKASAGVDVVALAAAVQATGYEPGAVHEDRATRQCGS